MASMIRISASDFSILYASSFSPLRISGSSIVCILLLHSFARISCTLEECTGVFRSLFAPLEVKSSPSTIIYPPTQMRPALGKAGTTTALQPSGSISSIPSISAPILPRSVLSILLQHNTPGFQYCSTAFLTSSFASCAGSALLSVFKHSASLLSIYFPGRLSRSAATVSRPA